MSQSLQDLRDTSVLLGVSGGIAAYKSCDVVSRLRKRGAQVTVVMTRAATQLVQPLTFQTVSDNPVYTDMFAEPKRWNVEHIELVQRADILAVVPATANIIAKAAAGIADDYLSTILVAFDGPKLMAPAMNHRMWENPVTQRNVRYLEELGVRVVEPDVGRLASGAVGSGRLPDPEALVEEISSVVHYNPSLQGRKVLVTAGPTREHFDPVHFLSNPSSGKMGYALAQAARERGAQVHLVSGPVNLRPPRGVRHHRVVSAADMLDKCLALWPDTDILLMNAAVADFCPASSSTDKLDKDADDPGGLVRTPDVIAALGERKNGQFILGFAAQTPGEDVLRRARGKLSRKGMDMIALNIVGGATGGFASDVNQVVLVSSGEEEDLPAMHKLPLARVILERVVGALGRRRR